MCIYPYSIHTRLLKRIKWHHGDREDGTYPASAYPWDGQKCKRGNSILYFHGTITLYSCLPLMHLSSRESFHRWSCPGVAKISYSTFCYTVRELTMLAWINELTDMPNWQCKIFNPQFVLEWKSAKVITDQDVTRSMADWVRLDSRSSGWRTNLVSRSVRWWSQILCWWLQSHSHHSSNRRRCNQVQWLYWRFHKFGSEESGVSSKVRPIKCKKLARTRSRSCGSLSIPICIWEDQDTTESFIHTAQRLYLKGRRWRSRQGASRRRY